MSLKQRTPIEQLEKDLTEETVTELHERGYTLAEIAEFVGEDTPAVRRAMGQYGLDPTANSGIAGHSSAAKLWEMDPDDLGGEA